MARTIYNRNKRGPKKTKNKNDRLPSAEAEQRPANRMTVRLETANEMMALIESAARSVDKPLPDFLIDAAKEKACQLLVMDNRVKLGWHTPIAVFIAKLRKLAGWGMS